MIYQDQCHGIARVTIELIRNLPAERSSDIVLLLARDRTTQFDIGDLEKYVRLEYCSSVIGRPYDLRDLWRTLRRLDAGVFYSPYHALAPLRVPCSLVVGLHDCIVETDRRLAGSWLNARLYRANTLRVLRQASAVVVPSVATKESLPAFYSTVPPTTVCLNGVDAAGWRVALDEVAVARRELNLPARYILHVGARRLHKNQRVLVEALPALDPDVSLVLLGHRDPRVADEVGELAARLGVTDRVIALEGVADSLLRGVYAGAEVFAFPSVVEGYGLPPLEAMAAGVPVVASATPAVAEVCHGAALLVSPFSPDHWVEALGAVLASSALKAELVAKGNVVAAAASWSDGAEQLYRVLSGFTAPAPVLVGAS